MTRASLRRKRLLPRSRANRRAGISKPRSFTKSTRNGTARWSITMRFCCATPTRPLRPKRVSALTRSKNARKPPTNEPLSFSQLRSAPARRLPKPSPRPSPFRKGRGCGLASVVACFSSSRPGLERLRRLQTRAQQRTCRARPVRCWARVCSRRNRSRPGLEELTQATTLASPPPLPFLKGEGRGEGFGSRRAGAERSWEKESGSFVGGLRAFFERVNALTRFGRKGRVGVAQQHFIVIDQRAVPFLVLFVKLRGLEIPARLFALERSDNFLGLRDARVVGIKGHEVGERGDGLPGGALVVLGGLRLFVVS